MIIKAFIKVAITAITLMAIANLVPGITVSGYEAAFIAAIIGGVNQMRGAIVGGLVLGVLDNYDKFKFTAPSNLPRVRTYQREYYTTSRVRMTNLQLTHVGKVSENQYYSAYGGYLESMFAGAGVRGRG